jgi:hypothetical protein
MSNITDAQVEAINNNLGLNSTYLTVDGQISGQAITETLVSGTAFQPSATREAFVYVNVVTSAALAISISSDNVTFVPIMASESAAIGLQTITLPAGWYIKVTGTVADLAVTAILK